MNGDPKNTPEIDVDATIGCADERLCNVGSMNETTTQRETTMPTKASLREGARELMRQCMARAKQPIDEAIVVRQAEKIVRHLWPTVKRAWKDVS